MNIEELINFIPHAEMIVLLQHPFKYNRVTKKWTYNHPSNKWRYYEFKNPEALREHFMRTFGISIVKENHQQDPYNIKDFAILPYPQKSRNPFVLRFLLVGGRLVVTGLENTAGFAKEENQL